MTIARILIIDDDPVLCTMLTDQLQRKGYTAEAVCTLQEGLSKVEEDGWDVVLLDVQMPDGNGLEFLPRFVKSASEPEVIIVTGHGAPDGAEKAVWGGAWTYIEKPYVIRDLPLHLTRALQYRVEKQRLSTVAPVALKRKNIIGESEEMHRCYDVLAKASVSDVSVLLTGTTGTGKELFARALHDNSSRAKRNFVVVDCASLPENLIESALFGHVRGAFTGADVARGGLVAHADEGTLFLDEVGELPQVMQKTFLRVLQERTYRPLGAGKEVQSNFRLVAATNRNLEEMVAHGTFRADLLYRLKGLTLHLPPLNQRKEDIKDLVVYCLERLCARYGRETKGISPDFIEALELHDWPGNVRELFQTIEQIFAGAVNVPTLFCVHLPESFRIRMVRAGIKYRHKIDDNIKYATAPGKILPWRAHKAEVEKDYLQLLVRESGGDMKVACGLSGLSRARMYQLLNQFEISLS